MTERAELGAPGVGGRLKLAQVVDRPLDTELHRTLVANARAGAEVVFCGVVRDHDHERGVQSLEYVAHPDADAVLLRVATRIATEPGVMALAVSHRVGSLVVGDVALVAAVSCAHRGLAFELCARLVDEVKRELPIWKRQVFVDGSDEWVNCP